MRPAPIIAVVALAGTVAAAQLTGSTASPHRPPSHVTAPVRHTTLVCPNLTGEPGTNVVTTAVIADVARALEPPSTSTGRVTTTVLKGAHSHPHVAALSPAGVIPGATANNGARAIAASGSIAATLVADQVTLVGAGRYRSLMNARCVPPSADWWFAGADGRVGYDDNLYVANPTDTAADVSVSVWSAKGQLTPPRLASVPIPPRSSVYIPVATVTPDAATLALHVHATSGAVTAALIDHRLQGVTPLGSDWIPATEAPARSLVVPGYPTGSGTRSLVIANPGDADATVNLKVVSGSGSFAPSGANQVVVPAGKTRIVDLSRAFAGSTGAATVQSDQPVVAQGLAVTTAAPKLSDLMWLAAIPPLTGPGAFADGHVPDGGGSALLLTAPQGAAQVRLTSLNGFHSTVTVPAGRSIALGTTGFNDVPIALSGLVVTPVGSAPVYVTRTMQLNGAHGALTTSEAVLSLPSAVELPVVTEDPRTAIRSAG
jgi:hypothetical protein